LASLDEYKEVIAIKRIIICILTILLSVIAGCSTGVSVKQNQDMPEDFDFTLSYGTYGKQKIDTFTDVVVKDLVEDGVFEANISFTEEEMKQIYHEMMKINVMGELDLDEDNECNVEPPSISVWKIQMDGKTKSFSYQSYCDYPKDALKLLKLEEYIHNIVSTKEEYKELPVSIGGYE
jgi:hypothetical protein